VISEVILTCDRKRWTPPGCWSALRNYLAGWWLRAERDGPVSRDLSYSAVDRRSSSRNRSSGNRFDSRNGTVTTTCWYHTRFGANAKKCAQPCSYKSKGKLGQQTSAGTHVCTMYVRMKIFDVPQFLKYARNSRPIRKKFSYGRLLFRLFDVCLCGIPLIDQQSITS
jgi:hypothetical protein